jgi:hypothetical protein
LNRPDNFIQRQRAKPSLLPARAPPSNKTSLRTLARDQTLAPSYSSSFLLPPPSSSNSTTGQILAHSGRSLPRRPSPQNPLPLLSVLPHGTRFHDRLHRAVEFGRPARPGLHRPRVAAAWKTIDNRVRDPWMIPAPVSPSPRPRSVCALGWAWRSPAPSRRSTTWVVRATPVSLPPLLRTSAPYTTQS